MSYFSEKLYYLRNRNGFTQAGFARHVGISRSAVGMYELGEREPTFKTLEKMALALRVTPGVLIGDYRKDKDYEQLLSIYIKLSQSNKRKVREFAEELVQPLKKSRKNVV